jgi:hypothetical protein
MLKILLEETGVESERYEWKLAFYHCRLPHSTAKHTVIMSTVTVSWPQTVSHWLPTLAAWVRAQAKSCGICDGQSGTGAGFLRVLQFPLPILIPSTAPYSSIIRGWYNMPNSGPHTKLTQSHPTQRTEALLVGNSQLRTALARSWSISKPRFL